MSTWDVAAEVRGDAAAIRRRHADDTPRSYRASDRHQPARDNAALQQPGSHSRIKAVRRGGSTDARRARRRHRAGEPRRRRRGRSRCRDRRAARPGRRSRRQQQRSPRRERDQRRPGRRRRPAAPAAASSRTARRSAHSPASTTQRRRGRRARGATRRRRRPRPTDAGAPPNTEPGQAAADELPPEQRTSSRLRAAPLTPIATRPIAAEQPCTRLAGVEQQRGRNVRSPVVRARADRSRRSAARPRARHRGAVMPGCLELGGRGVQVIGGLVEQPARAARIGAQLRVQLVQVVLDRLRAHVARPPRRPTARIRATRVRCVANARRPGARQRVRAPPTAVGHLERTRDRARTPRAGAAPG